MMSRQTKPIHHLLSMPMFDRADRRQSISRLAYGNHRMATYKRAFQCESILVLLLYINVVLNYNEYITCIL